MVTDLYYSIQEDPKVDPDVFAASSNIMRASNELALPTRIAVAACIILHRASLRIKDLLLDNGHLNVCACCMFLACKINEFPKPLVRIMEELTQRSNPDDRVEAGKAQVFRLERRLLIHLGFEIHAVLTRSCLTYLVSEINALDECLSDEAKQNSLAVLLDLHQSDACCRLPPYAIAASAIYIADRLTYPETHGRLAVEGWYKAFGLTRDGLEYAVGIFELLSDLAKQEKST